MAMETTNTVVVTRCTVQQKPHAPQTKIRKLREHAARPDTLRAMLLDLLMSSKTLGEAYSKHCEFRGRTCYVTNIDRDYAVKEGYIRLEEPQTARLARGGKAVFGARLGILMLEARFPRIPGDMGNASTWPFPVLYKVVRGASPQRVVRERAAGLLPAFLDAAKELVELGADGITTNCGFLSLYQDEIASHVGVPVATSSLMQAPFIQRTLPPGRRVGILTVSASTLTSDHLKAAGVAADTPVVGTDAGREFTRVIIANELEMNVEAAERDILEAGEDLVTRHTEVGAVLLECTNMVPYARALREHLSLPVFDIYSFMSWFHSGLSPRDFGHPSSAPQPWRER